MFPAHATGQWYLDMSVAGWMHALVMAMLLTVMLMYAVSPLPKNVVIAVSVLVSAHVFLGTAQPSWYATGKVWTLKCLGPALVTSALIWIIAALKIRFAKENF